MGEGRALRLLSVGRRSSPCDRRSPDQAERKPAEPTGAGGDDSAGTFCPSRV